MPKRMEKKMTLSMFISAKAAKGFSGIIWTNKSRIFLGSPMVKLSYSSEEIGNSTFLPGWIVLKIVSPKIR